MAIARLQNDARGTIEEKRESAAPPRRAETICLFRGIAPEGEQGLNLFIVIGCFGLLVLLLLLLEQWQQKLAEKDRERVLTDIRDAEERGTDKPLAQHPQIDEQACIGCGNCIAACPEDGVLGLVDGVAKVIHGSRCIGHGRCADVCPVNAIQVGLGELAKSPNLPVLTPEFETTVPGIYVAGELGGFALIRVAVEQGVKAVDEIARDLALAGTTKPRGGDSLDLLIVGAGPAGLAAALKAKERGLRYLLIDQDDIGGTVRKYPRRKLTLTGPLEMPLYGRVKREEFLKEELIEFWEKLIRTYELKIRTGVRLTGVERKKDAFIAQTVGAQASASQASTGAISARRIVMALGRRGTPKKLGVPGEDLEKVLYQLLDASTFTDTHILVVGGGDSAVEAATALASQKGNVVTLSYRRANFFRLKQRNEERIQSFQAESRLKVIFNSRVRSIDGGSVTLAEGEEPKEEELTIQNDYVFVFAGGEPPYPLLRGMGVRFNGDAAAPVLVGKAKELVEA